MDKAQFLDVVFEMIGNGYTRGAPKSGLANARQIDSEVCADACCEKCAWHGLSYMPFVKDGSYRAFSQCPECGDTQEF